MGWRAVGLATLVGTSACSSDSVPTNGLPVDAYAIIVDEARDQIVLFGASLTPNAAPTWRWVDGQWTVFTGASPPPRFHAAFAYDPARKVGVMFGGLIYDLPGPAPCDPAVRIDADSNVFCGDTWQWDGQWTKLDVAGPAPHGHPAGALVYVDSLRALVLSAPDATWSWDGMQWTNIGPGVGEAPDPQAYIRHGSYYDPAADELRTVAGQPFGRSDLIWRGDHWQEDPRMPLEGAPGVAFDIARGTAVAIMYPGDEFWQPEGDQWARVRVQRKYPWPTPSDDRLNDVAYDPRRQALVFAAQRTDCEQEKFGCTALYSFDGQNVRLLEE